MKGESETVAVYGGSFNPPHVVHALVASYVLCSQRVDKLLIVPAAQHPFAKDLAPHADRVAMCELAMRHLRGVEVSAIEAELPGPSLTLNTLQALQARMPSARLRFVLGTDILPETPKWHAFDRVRELAPPIVVRRAGYPDADAVGPLMPELSSSLIRELLGKGLSTEGYLDPEVAAYIDEHQLYRASV
jgi:nicotinate-nucleotide adenylyltransferase